MKSAWVLLFMAAGLSLLSGPSSVQSSALEHERLRFRNTFKTPEEVIGYYCARDASGFVWSGLLDAERKAFTVWREVPQNDSFYIARKYDISPSRAVDGKKDQAIVDVRYELEAIGDAHGVLVPAPTSPLVIRFNLKKMDGAWKIAKPDSTEIAPVVLQAKFPYAGK